MHNTFSCVYFLYLVNTYQRKTVFFDIMCFWILRTEGVDRCCGSHKSFQINTALWIFLQEAASCVNRGHTLPAHCSRRHRSKKRRWHAIGWTHSEYIFLKRDKCSDTAFRLGYTQGVFPTKGNSSHRFACCKKLCSDFDILSF